MIPTARSRHLDTNGPSWVAGVLGSFLLLGTDFSTGTALAGYQLHHRRLQGRFDIVPTARNRHLDTNGPSKGVSDSFLLLGTDFSTGPALAGYQHHRRHQGRMRIIPTRDRHLDQNGPSVGLPPSKTSSALQDCPFN